MGAVDEVVAKTAIGDLEARAPSPERGTLLLCSCPRRRTSIGLPNAERTLFTGALLSVLKEGSARASDMLSFADLRDEIYDQMLRGSLDYNAIPPRPVLHQPEQQEGDLTRLPAFPNVRAQLRRKAEEDARREVQGEARRKAEEERQLAEARHKAEQE